MLNEREREIIKLLEKNRDLIEASLAKQMELMEELRMAEKRLKYLHKRIERTKIQVLGVFIAGLIAGFLVAKMFF